MAEPWAHYLQPQTQNIKNPFAPMLPGFKYGTYNDVDAIKDLVTEKTCGVIVEPIQGEGGVIVATEEFLTALAARCREELYGPMLRYQKSAHPDMITTAKALGNGFPIGATIVNKNVTEKIKVSDHGTTFGGNPLASRIAHYIVSRLSDPSLQKDVIKKSKIFTNYFQILQSKHPELITEIRGRGLHLGLQLSQDPTPIVTAARERGLLIITAGTNTLSILEEAIKIAVSPVAEPQGVQVHGEVDSPN
ncbi:hypothetical protein DID88_000902 [Monilinia fructigena]|uniref:Ornithine aminotransferase n=1 Tax=Monilinia fructigena TaxID=38457 RepID=A0A395IZQ7_9HELO|nr:hypothetical protein DID88_000902 [Monilinia fructigena]